MGGGQVPDLSESLRSKKDANNGTWKTRRYRLEKKGIFDEDMNKMFADFEFDQVYLVVDAMQMVKSKTAHALAFWNGNHSERSNLRFLNFPDEVILEKWLSGCRIALWGRGRLFTSEYWYENGNKLGSTVHEKEQDADHWKDKIDKCRSMGFLDEALVLRILRKHKGSLSRTVDELINTEGKGNNFSKRALNDAQGSRIVVDKKWDEADDDAIQRAIDLSLGVTQDHNGFREIDDLNSLMKQLDDAIEQTDTDVEGRFALQMSGRSRPMSEYTIDQSVEEDAIVTSPRGDACWASPQRIPAWKPQGSTPNHFVASRIPASRER